MKRDDGSDHGSAIDAEIDHHLDRTTQEFIAAGHSPEQARRLALQRFGDVAAYRKRLTDMRRAGRRGRAVQSLLERLFDDVAFGMRYARRTPALTVGVAVTMALGVGANATMYSVIDRILLTPPPHIRSPARVKRLFIEQEYLGARYFSATVTYPDVLDWQAAASFESVAAFTQETVTMGVGEHAQRLPAVFATHNFFTLLGTAPFRGRLFTAEDDQRGAEPVAVVGYDFWQRDLGGRDNAIGTILDLGYARFRIVGVAPRGFTGIDLDRVDLWLPLFSHFDDGWVDSRGYYFLHAVARLAPGRDVRTAETEATLLHRRARASNRDYPPTDVHVSPLMRARGPHASEESIVAKWLAGVSLVVLVIACSNVANLLLAYGARQRREIAVRLALGVSRARLVRQILCGSFVFAMLGSLGAIAIARLGGVWVGNVLLPEVDWSSGVTNLRFLTFTCVVALLASTITALVPAIRSCGADLMGDLKLGSHGRLTPKNRLRRSLLVSQAALSMVLLVGSGLFVKSLHRVENVDLGIDPKNVFVVRLELPFDTPRETSIQAYQLALERLHGLPWIESVGTTTTVPFVNSVSLHLRASGRDSMPVIPSGGPYVLAVSPDYFRVMNIDVIKGRAITNGDVHGAPRVTVVNQTMARLVWPHTDPIGQCVFIMEPHLYSGGKPDEIPCTEVVGIVEDTRRQAVLEDEQMLYYVAAAQYALAPRGLMVHTPLSAERAVPELRRAVYGAVPEARYVRVQPMSTFIDPDLRSWKLGAGVFTAFGFLALVVAAVGLYSVLAFDVATRRVEIGVRSALGATSARLVRWVVREGILLVTTGIVCGAVIAIAISGTMQSLLYDTSARDPGTYLGVIAILLTVALLASLIPALRATGVEPVEALRTD